jgi:hypothetical protein
VVLFDFAVAKCHIMADGARVRVSRAARMRAIGVGLTALFLCTVLCILVLLAGEDQEAALLSRRAQLAHQRNRMARLKGDDSAVRWPYQHLAVQQRYVQSHISLSLRLRALRMGPDLSPPRHCGCVGLETFRCKHAASCPLPAPTESFAVLALT